MAAIESLVGRVGLFFYADKQWLLHTCSFRQAEKSGGFVNYPYSHETVWELLYFRRYRTDFDFYPRGRVIFDVPRNTYRIFYDGCIESEVNQLSEAYSPEHVLLLRDEHYQCSRCHANYIHIPRAAETADNELGLYSHE